MADELPVPVKVDPHTGVWSVDDVPMIFLPRHYWSAVIEAVESRYGVEAAADIYFEATHKSAYLWCEKEPVTHQLAGIEVFHHYMRRMTERGWGKFTVKSVAPENGCARIALEHSAIALARPDSQRTVCHSFNGVFCGAMEYVAAAAGQAVSLRSREIQCRANGAAYCEFEVVPG